MATVTAGESYHVRYTPRAGIGGDGACPGARWVLGEVTHYDGENPAVAGRQAAPLRELMDDRLLDALLERALEAELTAHLGYEKHDLAGRTCECNMVPARFT